MQKLKGKDKHVLADDNDDDGDDNDDGDHDNDDGDQDDQDSDLDEVQVDSVTNDKNMKGKKKY